MVQSWKVHKKGEDSKTSKEPEKTQIHIEKRCCHPGTSEKGKENDLDEYYALFIVMGIYTINSTTNGFYGIKRMKKRLCGYQARKAVNINWWFK
jgi:hypothetical protein